MFGQDSFLKLKSPTGEIGKRTFRKRSKPKVQRASKPTPKPKPRHAQCMIEGCKRPSKTRGVCGQCYSNARVLILNGDATWQELESIGLVRPAHDLHTKNLFRAAFLAAIEKQGSRGGKRARAAK